MLRTAGVAKTLLYTLLDFTVDETRLLNEASVMEGE
jgi:hypothetical protein